MRAIQILDMTAGALCLLIALEIGRGWSAPVARTTVTMRLDNGHMVYRNEALEVCEQWQAMLARGRMIQPMPWGEEHRITDIWCGTYRGESE